MRGGNYHVLLCIGFIKNVNGYTIRVSFLVPNRRYVFTS